MNECAVSTALIEIVPEVADVRLSDPRCTVNIYIKNPKI